ncbi:MAG: hypothetical protein QOI44_2172 [Actinomycetota bacterium]|nr:hypothetical protein [Actinomycetota bacterium]
MSKQLIGAITLGFVIVAAACGSSTPNATPKTPVKSTTTAAPTTSVPTVPGVGPIKLVSQTGVTPVELHRAETLIATTMVALKRFATPAQAYAAGYRSIGDAVTGDEHYVNWSYANDGHILDPKRPESIVYEVRNGKQAAVAAMYALPLGSSFANVPDVGGALTQWHVHRNLCLTDNPEQRLVTGVIGETEACPPGTTKAGNAPMLHVWTIPNVCGPFAALEGIGAGQVPAGQTRNCDTTNASVP